MTKLIVACLVLTASSLKALEAKRVSEIHDIKGTIGSIVLSTDGHLVAVYEVTKSYKFQVLVFESATGKKILTIETGLTPAFSPDGKTLFVADQGSGIEKWDIAGGKRLDTWKTGYARGLTVSPDGKTLILAIYSNGRNKTSIQAWDAEKGIKAAEWGEIPGDPRVISFDSAGRKLLTSSMEIKGQAGTNHLKIWDAAASPPTGIEGPPTEGYGYTWSPFSPDGTHLLIDRQSRPVLFDLVSKRELWTSDVIPFGAAFAPDGRTVLLYEDPVLTMFDAATGAMAGRADVGVKHEGQFCMATFSADATTLVTNCAGSGSPTITVWEVPDAAAAKAGLAEASNKEMCEKIGIAPDDLKNRLKYEPGFPDEVKLLLDKGADPNAECAIPEAGKKRALDYVGTLGNAALTRVFADASLKRKLPEISAAEKSGDDAAKAGKSAAALARYKEALGLIAGDREPGRRIREKVINLVSELETPPAIPDEAAHHMMRAEAFVKKAAGPEDYEKAAHDLEAAVQLAPWWAKAYFNLGLVRESLHDPKGATESLNLYLLAAPDAADAPAVKKKLVELEVDMERTQ